jgi:hypothetical protein
MARIAELAVLARCAVALRGPEFQELVCETFTGLQFESPEVAERRLGSPIFRGWLSWIGYGLNHLEEYGAFVDSQLELWNNMRFSMAEPGNYETVMGAIDGVCFTWDPRVTCEVGARNQVRVIRNGARLTVCDLTGEKLWDGYVGPRECEVQASVEGCRIRHAPCLPETEVVVRNDIPTLRLKLSGTSQRDTGIVVGKLEDSALFTCGPELCIEAADLLRQVWTKEYEDFSQTLQVVVPGAKCDDRLAKGMTVSSHQGAVWIMADDLLSTYESLVHEQSHVKLRYVEEAFPILAKEQTEERFKVAWRSDPRPIIGIYEGIYVSVHCAIAIDRALDSGAIPVSEVQAWQLRSKDLRVNVYEALGIMREHARFTEGGAVFVDWASSAMKTRDS